MKTPSTPQILFSFILIAFLFPYVLSAQPAGGQRPQGQAPPIGKLSGTLQDEQSQEALMFASIVLSRNSDSTMVTGTISNEQGKFVIEQIPPGHYYITVNYVGYPPKVINSIRITFREPEVDLGVIPIEPGVAMLAEVTVEARRQLMEVGLDRRVVNVDQELTASGGSALELMQNIPSVSVDFEGNVSLRGSSNVTILIDGRPSGLTGLSGSEALEQIPASMIERVEIVTNPSVRYDPAGTSGIINVVLKKQRQAGYNGLLSLNAGTNNRYTGSLNLNYKTGKFNFFGNLSGRFFNMQGYGNSFRTSFLSQTSYMDQQSDFKNKMNSQNYQLGIDYAINKYNNLTVSAMMNEWNRGGDNFTDYAMLNSERVLYNTFTRRAEDEMSNSGMSYNMSYRRTFEQRFRELTADVNFSSRNSNRSEDMVQQLLDLDKNPQAGGSILEKTRSLGDNYMLSAQIDYVHPLGESTKLEMGYRSIFREMDSDFNFLNFDQGSQSWINQEGRSNRFIYNEQVHAVYGIFATMLGKTSLQAGLRAEQTYTRAEQKTMNEVFPNDYLSFFPSLHLRRNFENNQAVQVSYSRRINRPNNRVLNPFVSYSDPYDLSFGNPYLDPEFTHSAEIGYTRFWSGTTINPSLFYRHTEGMVTRFRTMDEEGIAYSTFRNLNTGKSYGAELVLSQQLFKFWRANGTFSYYRQQIEGGDEQMELQADSYSWSARMVNNINLGKGFDLQVSAYYRSPVVQIQGEMREMYSMDMGLRKNVLDNKGTINLRMSDVFNTQKFRSFNYGDNFTIDSERKRRSQMIFLGFTYRINDYDRRAQQRRRTSDDNNGSMDMEDFD